MALGMGLLALGFFALVVFAAFVVVGVFFLLNLQETLRRVSPQNRRMTPGLVWLCLIPVFGIGWFIYTVIEISHSLSAEFQSRGWSPRGDFGQGVGLAAGVLGAVSLVLQYIPGHVSTVGGILSLGYVACGIIYWVRTAGYKSQLGPAIWSIPVVPPYSGYGFGPGATPGSGGPNHASSQDRRWGADPKRDSGASTQPGPAARNEDAADGPTDACPACDTLVMSTDRFCRYCGLPLP